MDEREEGERGQQESRVQTTQQLQQLQQLQLQQLQQLQLQQLQQQPRTRKTGGLLTWETSATAGAKRTATKQQEWISLSLSNTVLPLLQHPRSTTRIAVRQSVTPYKSLPVNLSLCILLKLLYQIQHPEGNSDGSCKQREQGWLCTRIVSQGCSALFFNLVLCEAFSRYAMGKVQNKKK